MSERFAHPPLHGAWTKVDDNSYNTLWDRFDQRFGFRAGVDPSSWPAISEPVPSVTLDLSTIPDDPQRGAAYDAIKAEALRSFVWSLPDVEELVALDWQHPAYLFRPAVQALTWRAEWAIPVFPDGDYFAFVSPDYNHGTFGHPWENTLCIMGEPLLASLAGSLSTWLPVTRRNGSAA